MQSMKIIKRRISSVSGTQKIMRAMDLVATSKLQKAKLRLEAAIPLFEEAKRTMGNLKSHEATAENIFVKQREVKNTAYIVMTGNRGLCGGYNLNISNKALSLINAGGNEKIIAVGMKGWEFFRRRKKNIVRRYRYAQVSEAAYFEDAEIIGNFVTSLYTSGEVDEVYVAYTKFESTMSHVPCVEKIFPISDGQNEGYEADMMEYDPDADTFLTHVAPMYLNVIIYGALVHSAACEQAARMVSMDAASNNADEIIENLSRMYNRIRQSAITQEINEIVSGANAHA